MTTSFALKIFFEIGLVMLIAYGYKNEDKLIEFETELFAILKFAFRKYILKNTGKKNVRNTVVRQTVSQQSYVVAEHGVCRNRAEIKAFPVSHKNRNVA